MPITEAELPKPAQVKLEQMRGLVEDADALHQRATDSLRELMREGSDPQLSDEERERVVAKADAVRQTQQSRDQVRADRRQVLLRVQEFLVRCPSGTRLWSCPPSPLSNEAKADPGKALLETRAEIDVVTQEIIALKRSPLSVAGVTALGQKWLRDLRDAASPAVSGDGRLTFRQPAGSSSTLVSSDAAEVKLLGILMRIIPDQVEAALAAEVERVFGPTEDEDAAMASPEEKRGALDKLRDRRLRLERLEETLVSYALDKDTIVERRPSANPLAVLMLARDKDDGKALAVA
jgi:hypothetical protein